MFLKLNLFADCIDQFSLRYRIIALKSSSASAVHTKQSRNQENYSFVTLKKDFKMPYRKDELLQLPLEERKELASDLIDSILAEEMKPIPEWKKELIQERIKHHNENPGNGME